MDDRRPPERLEECRQQQHQQRRAMAVIAIAALTAMHAMALEGRLLMKDGEVSVEGKGSGVGIAVAMLASFSSGIIFRLFFSSGLPLPLSVSLCVFLFYH